MLSDEQPSNMLIPIVPKGVEPHTLHNEGVTLSAIVSPDHSYFLGNTYNHLFGPPTPPSIRRQRNLQKHQSQPKISKGPLKPMSGERVVLIH